MSYINNLHHGVKNIDRLLNYINIQNIASTEKPLIFNNKPFMIRLYIIIIRNKANIVAFLFNKGIIIRNEIEGNKYYIYPEFIDNNFGKWYYINMIDIQIKDILYNLLNNTYLALCCPNNIYNRYQCYELVSLDFSIDCNFKVKLIDGIKGAHVPNIMNKLKKIIDFNVRNIINADPLFLTTKTNLGDFQNIFIKNVYPFLLTIPITKDPNYHPEYEGFTLSNSLSNTSSFMLGYLNLDYLDTKYSETHTPVTIQFIFFIILIINIFVILYFFSKPSK
jgi:hypothetical protein